MSLMLQAVASKNQQKQMSHVISGSSSHGPLKDVSNASSSSHQLPGMQITGNNTVNIYFSQVSQSSQAQSMSYTASPRTKRRKYIFKIVTMI